MLELRDLYPEALFIVYIEANMSFIEANRLKGVFSQEKYGLVHVMSRDPKKEGRDGVWTDAVAKKMFALDLQRVMSNGQLSFGDQMVSDNGEMHKMKLLDQMQQFCRAVTQPKKDSSQMPKITYSGKGPGQRDDLVLGLMIALTHSIKTKNEQWFHDKCQEQGQLLRSFSVTEHAKAAAAQLFYY